MSFDRYVFIFYFSFYLNLKSELDNSPFRYYLALIFTHFPEMH